VNQWCTGSEFLSPNRQDICSFLDLDWISFSLQLDPELDYPNEINCDHRKNLKWINSVWEEKIHYLQMILVKIYFSIFSRFRVIFPVARDPNFQAREERTSQLSCNMHCNLELCEGENDSIVLL